jgi:thiamine pyrophosphokinase
VRFAFRRGIGWLLKDARALTVDTQQGQRVSLVPLTACTGATIEGVAWPLNNEPLQPGGRVSVSNEATGDRVSAQVKTGAALLFVESAEVAW